MSIIQKIIVSWLFVIAMAVAGFVALFIGGMDLWVASGISLICFAVFFATFNNAYNRTEAWMKTRREKHAS
jgi:hypothetical protein